MINPPKRNNKESGNILIYIMGAILLLGLLVIISKGSNTPGAGIDQETLSIRVSEVQSYGQELERAVAYVLANGHSEADIRFAHPDAASAYGDITDDPTRQVFSRQGGAATYRQPPEGIQTTVTPWIFNSKNQVREIGTTCGAPECADIVAILPYVTKNLCLVINEKNGIQNIADSPPQDDGNVDINNTFDGTFNVLSVIGDPAPNYLSRKLEGCFEGGGDPAPGTYHYYRVLLPR